MLQYVLIVDDDIEVQDVMREYFMDYGLSRHRIFTASNPMEALDIFNVNKDLISLVICDHYMPIANGPEICEIMKKASPSLKIVLHTGDLNITLNPEASVDYILYKPCTIVEVLRIIKEVEFQNNPKLIEKAPVELVGQYQIGHLKDRFGKNFLGTVCSQSKGGCAMSFQTPVTINEDDAVEVSLGRFEEDTNNYVVLFKTKARIVWVKKNDMSNAKMGIQFL